MNIVLEGEFDGINIVRTRNGFIVHNNGSFGNRTALAVAETTKKLSELIVDWANQTNEGH